MKFVRAIAKTFGDVGQASIVTRLVSSRKLPNGAKDPSYDDQIEAIRKEDKARLDAFKAAQAANITKRDSLSKLEEDVAKEAKDKKTKEEIAKS